MNHHLSSCRTGQKQEGKALFPLFSGLFRDKNEHLDETEEKKKKETRKLMASSKASDVISDLSDQQCNGSEAETTRFHYTLTTCSPLAATSIRSIPLFLSGCCAFIVLPLWYLQRVLSYTNTVSPITLLL